MPTQFFSTQGCEVNTVIPWGANGALTCNVSYDGLTPSEVDQLQTEARQSATEIVDRLSGRQFGLSTDRIMPADICCRRCIGSRCSSCLYDAIMLPRYPVCEVTRVVIECEDQPLENYRVDWGETAKPLLVKLDGRWPSKQCFDDFCDPDEDGVDSGSGGWWVEYSYGRPVPVLGHLAVNELACQLLLRAENSSECVLPVGTTQVNRQGVTILVDAFQTFLDEGLTGLAAADRFIRLVNPKKLTGQAYVARPGATRSYLRVPC